MYDKSRSRTGPRMRMVKKGRAEEREMTVIGVDEEMNDVVLLTETVNIDDDGIEDDDNVVNRPVHSLRQDDVQYLNEGKNTS